MDAKQLKVGDEVMYTVQERAEKFPLMAQRTLLLKCSRGLKKVSSFRHLVKKLIRTAK
jgi:hypothetical protein